MRATDLSETGVTERDTLSKTHAWVHPITFSYVPGALSPALEQATEALQEWLRAAGCAIESVPTNATDLIITTARFGAPVERDEALFFQAKRRHGLSRRPRLLTIVDVPEVDYQRWLDRFAGLARQPDGVVPERPYPGLGPHAVEVLARQAKRGGPEVAMGRFLQAQAKSIQLMALRSDGAGRALRAVHFDLAGAHPVTEAADLDAFAEDAGYRLLAAVCAEEVNGHVFLPDLLPRAIWDSLATPDAMIRAGHAFTEFGFFTEPVYVEKLLGFRGVSDAISAQYSEGCYAAFDPDISGLVITASGSSRLVDKRSIGRDDQAIVVGIKPERDGAIVRKVKGMDTIVPSVEAVEMMRICEAVPRRRWRNSRGEEVTVPAIRAILHGHIGVAAYNPEYVECVSLDTLYHAHLVTCGTNRLADATAAAFARSVALRDPADPRTAVFLEQPGHGVVVAEKWLEGKSAFDAIYEYVAEGHLRVAMQVPQGTVRWEALTAPDGRRMMQKVE